MSSNWLVGIDLADFGESDPEIRRFTEIIFSGYANEDLNFPQKHLIFNELKKYIDINSKWACVHSRSSEYSHNAQKGMSYSGDFSQENRNTSINNFGLTINYLIDNGYSIFIMGENNNINIINNNIYRFENQKWKNDQLNIDIIQTSDLFIGSQSGLASVAQMANVPTIITNYVTYSHCYNNSSKTYVIPKLILNNIENRFLTLSEIIKLGIFEERNSEIFNRLNLSFKENSETEILSLVLDLTKCEKNNKKEGYWKCKQREILINNNLHYYYNGIELSSYIHHSFCEKYDFLVS